MSHLKLAHIKRVHFVRFSRMLYFPPNANLFDVIFKCFIIQYI